MDKSLWSAPTQPRPVQRSNDATPLKVIGVNLGLADVGDLILDVNDFEYAKSALKYYNLPIDDKATKAAAEIGDMIGPRSYQEIISTHATLKILQTTDNLAESHVFGALDANPSKLLHKTIKRLYLSLGKIHHAKFIEDIIALGYEKVRTENVELEFIGTCPQTVYQNGNKLCRVIYNKDNTTLFAYFERSTEKMSEEEKSISNDCMSFLMLEVNHESPTFTDGTMNFQMAGVKIEFPNERQTIDIPYDILEGTDKELEHMHRSGTYMGWELIDGQVPANLRRSPVRVLKMFIVTNNGEIDSDIKRLPDLSSQRAVSLKARLRMENALVEWLAPYIKVNKPAVKSYPRFGKEFAVNSGINVEIQESKEDLDTCRLHLNVKRKGYSDYEYSIKNSKEVQAKLHEFYGNEDILPALYSNLKRKMDRNQRIGDKFKIDVYIYRHSVKFAYNGNAATYMLPYMFEWNEPQK